MNCPNCSKKLNYWHQKVKIETKEGYEKVNKCPKCNGYFKESFYTNSWWSILPLTPSFILLLVSDKFEVIKYSILAILFVVISVVLFVREKKKKRIIQKKGEWIVVKAKNADVK